MSSGKRSRRVWGHMGVCWCNEQMGLGSKYLYCFSLTFMHNSFRHAGKFPESELNVFRGSQCVWELFCTLLSNPRILKSVHFNLRAALSQSHFAFQKGTLNTGNHKITRMRQRSKYPLNAFYHICPESQLLIRFCSANRDFWLQVHCKFQRCSPYLPPNRSQANVRMTQNLSSPQG